jgi:hypothetical protein
VLASDYDVQVTDWVDAQLVCAGRWRSKELKWTYPHPTSARSLGLGPRQVRGLRVAPCAQELRYVAKSLILELLQNGFERCWAMTGAMRARVGAPQAIVEAHELPWFKMPLMAESEEWAAMPEAERMGLEVRDMAEPECETPVVAEPQSETLVAEVPRLEMWNMSEPE